MLHHGDVVVIDDSDDLSWLPSSWPANFIFFDLRKKADWVGEDAPASDLLFFQGDRA